MSRRATLITGAASYIHMGSFALAGLVSIPLALKYLDTERMGLWTFSLQSLGYFMLLDLGVTNSMGRLMGEPVHSGDPKECSRWYSLFTLVLSLQGLLVLLAGYLMVDLVLKWFGIAPHLKSEARSLWLILLLLNGLAFPLRPAAGILFAQNRYYWVSLSAGLSAWVGLLGFYIFLKLGTGSLAYAYSAVPQMLVWYALPWLAMHRGPQRFRFRWDSIRWGDVKYLFNYSSAIFIIGLAVQVIFLSQSLIITPLFGLAVVTLFTVSTTAGTKGLQLLWRAFDAMNPRWQQLYVAGDHAHLRGSYQRYTGLVMSLVLCGSTLVIVLNHPFVNLWTMPTLYVGSGFDLLLAVYMIQHTWDHCMGFCPVIAKKIAPLAWLSVLEMILNIASSVILGRIFGVNGVLAGGILGSLVTTFYLTVYAPRYISLSAKALVMASFCQWAALVGFAGLSFVFFRFMDPGGTSYSLRVLFSALDVGLFLFLYRADVEEFLGRAKLFSFRKSLKV
jgi:O-antigen/teichoic acid export membrane protein